MPLETGPCKELTIKSSNGSKVVIETEDAYSPCIGKSSIIHEDTGYVMRQDNTLKKIILDNVHLRLVPKHTAFSIGVLGAEDFPKNRTS